MSHLLMKSVNKYSKRVILSRLTFSTTPLLSYMCLRVRRGIVTSAANPSNSADVLSRYHPGIPLLQPSRFRKALTKPRRLLYSMTRLWSWHPLVLRFRQLQLTKWLSTPYKTEGQIIPKYYYNNIK
jgi:hypothetical protein